MRSDAGRAALDVRIETRVQLVDRQSFLFVHQRGVGEPEGFSLRVEARCEERDELAPSALELASELGDLLRPRLDRVARRLAGTNTPQRGVALRERAAVRSRDVGACQEEPAEHA